MSSRSSFNQPTHYSKKHRERLHNCTGCNSMNTRLNINGNRLKCLDCGITSKFAENVFDEKKMWYDLLKIENGELNEN